MTLDRFVRMTSARAAACVVLALAAAGCIGAPVVSEAPDIVQTPGSQIAASPTPASPPPPSPTPAPSPISSEAAIEAVQAFIGKPAQLTATGPQTVGIGTVYQVEGTDVRATVDAYSGRVAMLLLLSKIPESARTLTDAQALAAAQKYLADHGISVDGMRSTVEWADQGATGNYTVTWQLYQGEIKMPEETMVALDGATGEVFSFHNIRAPHGRAPDPRISRDQAEAAAIAASGVSNPGVKSAELAYTYPMTAGGLDSTAPLVLILLVAVDTKTQLADEGCIVWVDAMTGAAQVIGRH